jgi:hypothetical protein
MKSIAFMAGVLTVASIVLASPPEIPKTPAAVKDVLYARSFKLEEPAKFIWCKERPNITTGTLLVLEVDPAYVVPREAASPVLYVGAQPAQPVNHGNESGHVVAIVPGEVDLTKVPVWFGTPGIAHLTDQATAKSELALAKEAGIKPLSKEKSDAARAKGGALIEAANMSALLRDEVAELILEYCPDEKHLAEGFRRPVLTKRERTDVEGSGD